MDPCHKDKQHMIHDCTAYLYKPWTAFPKGLETNPVFQDACSDYHGNYMIPKMHRADEGYIECRAPSLSFRVLEAWG